MFSRLYRVVRRSHRRCVISESTKINVFTEQQQYKFKLSTEYVCYLARNTIVNISRQLHYVALLRSAVVKNKINDVVCFVVLKLQVSKRNFTLRDVMHYPLK